MELSSPTPTPVGGWPLVVPLSPSSEGNRESKPTTAVVDESNDEVDPSVESSEAVAVQPKPTSDNLGMHDGAVTVPLFHRASYGESRSPSPPSEFDLQGGEKEPNNDVQEKEQELYRVMKDVSASISRIHVSAVIQLLASID
jgi:hypothetical protein